MKKHFPTAIVALDALVYIGFGIAFLVAPAELLGEMDIAFGSASSYVEVRAMYGGLELGIGLFLLGTFRGWLTTRQALALSGLSLGGLGGMRLLGLLLAPEFYPLHAQFAAIELLGAAANGVAWWMAGRTS